MTVTIVGCVALIVGIAFGWIMCAVCSVSKTNEEWQMMMEELERQRYGEVHQEEPRR